MTRNNEMCNGKLCCGPNLIRHPYQNKKIRKMLTCLFDLNSTATVAASHIDQESNESIVEVCWM